LHDNPAVQNLSKNVIVLYRRYQLLSAFSTYRYNSVFAEMQRKENAA